MKRKLNTSLHFFHRYSPLVAVLLLTLLAPRAYAASAQVLFQDDFTGGIPGWTAVQPAGTYSIDGPMLWQFDKVSNAFSEQSNIYTGTSGAGSATRIAVMLISDAVAPASDWEYKARLTAGDDDGFGLIWAYENSTTFYRVAFGRQSRTGWPLAGVTVDRMSNGVPTDISVTSSFVNTANRPFDVTIAVTNSLLTLTVVDDPLGSPIPYNLVTDQALPVAPSGRVGMFSWGMQAGTPRAFRFRIPC